MSDPSNQAPTPAFIQPSHETFPGPLAALALIIAAYLTALSLVTLLVSAGVQFIAALGIGTAIGVGGVATLAAKRVPEPQTERIGLCGFDWRLVVPLLALLPSIIVISELDNWHRALFPPPPEAAEMRAQLEELLQIDSVFAGMQTLVVAVGILPVIEGFFFFGVILQGLVAQLGRARGVVVTAILYSIVHLPVSGAPGDAVAPLSSALILGLIFTLARLGTGSILAPILLAALVEILRIGARAFAEQLPIRGFTDTSAAHTPAILVIPCVISVLYGIWTLHRRALLEPIQLPIPEATAEDDEHHFHF
jgi:membrane protease YdiL (CAAX protease family)